MDISRDDIFRVYPAGRKRSVGLGVLTGAALDVAFDVVLHELYRHGLYEECGLSLKGGTALRKFDIGHQGRFSFDLDFDSAEAPDAVAEMMDEALKTMPDHSFRMAITEHRGHYTLAVQSDLFPEGSYDAKLDFSPRGHCLPTRNISPLDHPLSSHYPFAMDFKVPLISKDENIAEKLSRWRSRPLVRDLYDLSELAGRVDDHSTVATMYVLKSYLGWVTAPPNRRPPMPAVPLMSTLEDATVDVFDLDDLVMPTYLSDDDKRRLIKQRLQRMGGLFERLDVHIRGDSLQRFASNTDGHLGFEARQQLESLDTGMGASDGLSLPGT